MTTHKTLTVTEVAQLLGKTTGRVRQICLAENIGHKFNATVPLRLLTPADVKKLRAKLRTAIDDN